VTAGRGERRVDVRGAVRALAGRGVEDAAGVGGGAP
jgi:hypothetical protein